MQGRSAFCRGLAKTLTYWTSLSKVRLPNKDQGACHCSHLEGRACYCCQTASAAPSSSFGRCHGCQQITVPADIISLTAAGHKPPPPQAAYCSHFCDMAMWHSPLGLTWDSCLCLTRVLLDVQVISPRAPLQAKHGSLGPTSRRWDAALLMWSSVCLGWRLCI